MLIYDSNGPELIRGRIWLTLICLAVFAGVAWVFMPNQDIILAEHILRTAIWATVAFVYTKEAAIGFWRKVPERTDYLIVGIWLSAISNVMQSLLGAAGRVGGLPSWWLNTDLVVWTLALSIGGGVLHVSAPDAAKEGIPSRTRIAMGVFVGLAVLACVTIAATSPDIGPLLEKVRPYISGGTQASPPGVG